MSELSSNKIIAKNTVLLYFRMMLTMVVSLYTSRVILDVLGVDDFGIYQTVGGIVMMLAFVNNALANGTSRFLTYELGTGDTDKLKRTFSTVLWTNVGLAILVVILAETIGLWLVYNKLVIPLNRLDAAIIAYHLSVLTCFFQLALVPFNASIISHEKMGVYAYMGIIDVCMKLAICYLLNIGGMDKLIIYASLLCLLQVIITFAYIIYCKTNFNESQLRLYVDWKILKNVISYSSWSMIASSAIALNAQGITVLINMFFSPAVVSARAIANQVNMAANQFLQNFRTAVTPQIVKKYAAGDYEGSKYLLLESTIFSYYLMLLLAMPIFMVADILLGIWLKDVPEYTTVFLQLAILTSLFQVFDTSFYTALYAKGQIKENALLSPTLALLVFPVTYFLFELGFSPVASAWTMFVVYAFAGLILKPILIIKIVGYTWSEIMKVFKPCFWVSIISAIIPVVFYIYRNTLFPNTFLQFFMLSGISILSVAVTVWVIGLDKGMKEKIVHLVKSKIKK